MEKSWQELEMAYQLKQLKRQVLIDESEKYKKLKKACNKQRKVLKRQKLSYENQVVTINRMENSSKAPLLKNTIVMENILSYLNDEDALALAQTCTIIRDTIIISPSWKERFSWSIRNTTAFLRYLTKSNMNIVSRFYGASFTRDLVDAKYLSLKDVLKIIHLLGYNLHSLMISWNYDNKFDEKTFRLILNEFPRFRELEMLSLRLPYHSFNTYGFSREYIWFPESIEMKSIKVFELQPTGCVPLSLVQNIFSVMTNLEYICLHKFRIREIETAMYFIELIETYVSGIGECFKVKRVPKKPHIFY